MGQDPVRTATLAYDAVALVAALVKTQGAQRFSEQVLTNSSRASPASTACSASAPTAPMSAALPCCAFTPGGGQVVSPVAAFVRAGNLSG